MRIHRGSYTIEAAILVPLVIFMMVTVIRMSIGFLQEAAERESLSWLVELDIVQEFYDFQILEEIGEEIFDD